MFWLEHYIDHSVRFFWAVHVTHHSSEEYNLTTGFRSSVLMPFYRYLYFIPLALLGFQPIDVSTAGRTTAPRYKKKMPRAFPEYEAVRK